MPIGEKRPPPSPIVAPPPVNDDNNEEQLAAEEEILVGEPPAKIPKLDLGIHAAVEAAAAAAAAAVKEEPVGGGTAVAVLPQAVEAPSKSEDATEWDTTEGNTEEPPLEEVVMDEAAMEEVTAASALLSVEAVEAPTPMLPDQFGMYGAEAGSIIPVTKGAGRAVEEVEAQDDDGAAVAEPWAQIVEEGHGNVNAVKTEDVHEVTAKVTDVAVMDTIGVATKTIEGDNEAVLPASNLDEAANETSDTVAKKVDVILDACMDGNTINAIHTAADILIEEQKAVKKSKKERKEFTAQEKLQILSELSGPNAPSALSLRLKYGVSKSSLHRWRQPDKIERLQEMARGAVASGVAWGENSHLGIDGDKSKKRDMNDKLRKIKMGLESFCNDNLARPEDERLAITSSLIQLKATEIKEELLERHLAAPGVLADEEAVAIRAFKGSKSWACLMGNQLGFLSAARGVIKWSDAAKSNTALYLDANSRNPPKPKKQRMEFTAEEKLGILQELENTNAQNKTDGAPLVTVEQICKKYHTSKSSLHRWKQQYKNGRLQELAEPGSGYKFSKRIFNDKLYVIKKALNEFYNENEKARVGERPNITYTMLQARAIMAKEVLLERHYVAVAVESEKMLREQQREGAALSQQSEVGVVAEQHGGEAAQPQEGEGAVAQQDDAAVDAYQKEGEGLVGEKGKGEAATQTENGSDDNSGGSSNDILTKEEVHSLENFKASNSWLRETAKKFGWKLDTDGKKDGVGMDSIGLINGIVNSAAVAPEAVYHYPDDHHTMEEHPAVEHLGVEQCHVSQAPPVVHDAHEHPVAGHHDLAQDHPSVEHHHLAAVHAAAAVEQGGGLGVVGEEHFASVMEQHHVSNDHHHHQQEQHIEHLAPTMAGYDEQGNGMTEILEDPLVHVEGQDVGVERV